MKKYFQENKHVLVLFILALAGYWQIAFLQNSVTWDMLDALLPWKYFTGECLQNGIFPYWNPYQQMGYPIHADLKTVLYPETILIGSILGYTNYTFHFLLIFYIFLAGLGMYKLSFYLNKNKQAALVAGIVFMFCGYFVQQAQDLLRITGGAFIPFIILYYLKIINEKKYTDVLKAAFFLFLMFTGGYQALTFILFYLLLLIFLYKLMFYLKEKKYRELVVFAKVHFVLIILILILSSVIIVTVYQVSPYLQRIGGLPLKQAMFGPFSPQSSISFLIPFSVVKDIDFFNTDISMNNAFSGILILLLFIISIFRKKNPFEYILILFGIFCLIVSFGEYTPLREFLYKYIPLFNLSRFPSYFSLFMVIAIIVTGTNQLALLSEQKNTFNKKPFFLIGSGFIITLFIFLFYSISKIDFSKFAFINQYENFYEMLRNSTLHEHIFIHSIIQIIIIGILLFFVKKAVCFQSLSKKLQLLIIAEMLIATQLNIYYTATNEVKPSELHSYFSTLPKGFPLPDNKAIAGNTDNAASHFPLWRNTNNFVKKISPDGFNSFQLNAHDVLYDSFPALKQAVLNNPLLYLSDQIAPFSKIKDSLDPLTDNKTIYVEEEIFKNINSTELKVETGDTVSIISFSPNKIEALAQNSNSCIITLLQSNYLGWQATVNGKHIPIFTSNKLFMSAILQPGKNSIIFEYKNPAFKTGFFISYIVFGLLCIVLAILKIREIKEKYIKL